jgi:hypothetical protein
VKINRGILTGCNDAFIISGEKRDEILRNCATEYERSLTVELIRPILRGKDIKRYGYTFANQYLIATHNGYRDDNGYVAPPININDYPALKAHLDDYWDIISVRTDKGVTPYNLRNCAYMDDFSKQKIVWGNLNLAPKYALVEEGMFANAPSPMIVPGTLYLLAFLNSTACDWYFKIIAVERSGGFFEYKPMFIERLPIPRATVERKNMLEPLVTKLLISYSKKIESDIEKAVNSIFRFTAEEIELLENSQYSEFPR